MRKKRPCTICRIWFLPDAHAGNRQKTCGRPECQRERHRRSCKRWHRKNPDYDRERRLKKRLLRERNPENQTRFQVDPQSRLDPFVVRDAVGLEGAIIIEEYGKVLVGWVRDAVDEETEARCGFARKLMPPGKRDAIVGFCHPP